MAWQCEVHATAGGATSTASSPKTPPIRPPLETRHVDEPPDCATFTADCGLSRPTKADVRSVAKFTRSAMGTGVQAGVNGPPAGHNGRGGASAPKFGLLK